MMGRRARDPCVQRCHSPLAKQRAKRCLDESREQLFDAELLNETERIVPSLVLDEDTACPQDFGVSFGCLLSIELFVNEVPQKRMQRQRFVSIGREETEIGNLSEPLGQLRPDERCAQLSVERRDE